MNLKNLYGILERFASKSGILILFILSHTTLLLMMLFTFPQINDKMGTEAFDLKPYGYTQSEAIVMIQNLDQTTIDLYVFPQLFLLDVLYPLLLALFLSTVILRLSKLIKLKANRFYSNLIFLPFIAMFIDYIENVLIWRMISNPIEESSEIIKIASLATQLKGIFTTLSWIVIVILFILWLRNKWFNNKVQSGTT